MNVPFTSKLVLGADDSIDEAATVAAFEGQLAAYVQELAIEGETIAAAVHAVFDLNRGATVNMPYIVGTALRTLNPRPENFNSLSDKIHAYVSSNSDRLANAKKGIEAEPPRTRLFGIKKGQGGGVVRWADAPEKTESK
jgi:hypothetical protein